jgi:hypothetical protein
MLKRLRSRLLAISDLLTEHERQIEARGFLAQRRYREVYEREARSEDELASLLRYWNETRKEYLGTAGCAYISPVHRKVPQCALYRSSFLDSLHAAKVERGDDVREIEACHRRLHDKMREGAFIDWTPVASEKKAEAHGLLRDIAETDSGGRPVWSDFKNTLKVVSSAFAAQRLTQRSRRTFHFFERQLASLPTISAFICHEDERPLRAGSVAFFIAFAPHGATIDPSRPHDPVKEARLGFESIVPGFAAYSHFGNPEERALCAAAHVFAGDRLFALLDA